jgi:hypothetical protein
MIKSVLKLYIWNRETGNVDIPAGYRIIMEDGTGMTVPLDPENSDNILIQKWIAEGNTPTTELADE